MGKAVRYELALTAPLPLDEAFWINAEQKQFYQPTKLLRQ